MSPPLFPDDVLFLQRFLKSLGLYTKRLDGDWGDGSRTAFAAFEAQSAAVAAEEGTFDARTEGNLRTLHPTMQRQVRRGLAALRDAGVSAKVISGTRSYAEQDRLFAQGRNGNPGPKVTNARGGQSNHNFFIAVDLGLFDGTRYLTDEASYVAAAAVVKAAAPGLAWGGDWKSLRDTPHYELATGLGIAEVRRRFELGEAYAPALVEGAPSLAPQSAPLGAPVGLAPVAAPTPPPTPAPPPTKRRSRLMGGRH